MKGVDYMLIAIIVYLIIGGIITVYLRNTLGDIVKGKTLTMKVLYYVWTVVIAPPLFIYGIAKGAYQEFKNKSES